MVYRCGRIIGQKLDATCQGVPLALIAFLGTLAERTGRSMADVMALPV